MSVFHNQIRQIFFLILVTALAILLFRQLYVFFPGFLGALTLYILGRHWYKFLTLRKSWNKSLTAVLFMTAFMICIVTPIYFSTQLLFSKIQKFIQDPAQINHALEAVSAQIKDWTGKDVLSKSTISDLQKKATGLIPMVLNGSATMLGNLIMILFLSFFMFVNGVEIEKTLPRYIPLRKENIDLLSHETTMMVKANALGIPLVSIIQGACAVLGYWIFGVEDFVLLGFVTGLFSFFPIVGTAVIWLPVVIFLLSSGENGRAIGLAIYSLVITGNVDYLARITFLKKIGDVHPVTTILGLIVGLKLFGFWGFIFGPLLISYFMLLIKIYASEFGQAKHS